MNIEIQKENNVLIINVVLIPYRDKKRDPLIKREIFNSKIATFKISKPKASKALPNNFKLDKRSSPVVKSNRKKPLTTDE